MTVSLATDLTRRDFKYSRYVRPKLERRKSLNRLAFNREVIDLWCTQREKKVLCESFPLP
jgi:hypothetical protein